MDTFIDTNNKKIFFNTLFTLLIILILFIGTLTVNALKENSHIGRNPNSTHTVAVSGHGEVIAVPDTGSFSFSVTETAKVVADAQNAAAKKTNDIITALKALGVDEKDIQTQGYNTYPKYNYNTPNLCVGGACRGGTPVIVGYEVSQSITVKVRKTADAGSILTKVGTLGASNISGLNFTIDNPDMIQTQARDKAIANAKTKAGILAKSLGIRLEKIVNFDESGNPRPILYGGIQTMDAKSASVGSGVSPQIPTGENKLTSDVTLTYEIE